VPDRDLHRPLGNPDQVREYGVTDCHGLPAGPVGVAIELHINEKGGGGAAVRDQVSHQGVNQVWIYFHRYSNNSYSNGFREYPIDS
jgi:hypothetical protein